MSGELHLDSSLSIMEETRFRKKYSSVIKKLTKESHFSHTEVESVCIMYYKFQAENKGHNAKVITKTQLVNFFHNALDMTETQMLDSVVYAALGKGSKQAIGMEEWTKYLSLILRGTMEEKIKHCFSMYDLMGSGKLSRDEMIGLLSHTIISEEGTDNDDVIKDLVEIITKKLDLDRDGKISFDDFRKAILKTPLLLECLGPCLPSRLAIRSFLSTFTVNVQHSSSNSFDNVYKGLESGRDIECESLIEYLNVYQLSRKDDLYCVVWEWLQKSMVNIAYWDSKAKYDKGPIM